MDMSAAARWITFVMLLGIAACGDDEPSSAAESLVTATSAGPSELPVVDPTSTVPIGQPHQIEIGTHCGVGVLGLPVNGIVWMTDTARGERNWMPSEWASILGSGEELITLEVVLSDSATLTASANGVSVTYRPVTADDEVPDCA
jgi:hypothetical protein